MSYFGSFSAPKGLVTPVNNKYKLAESEPSVTEMLLLFVGHVLSATMKALQVGFGAFHSKS